MDKTLNRDLTNLCWRLLVYQCDLLQSKLQEYNEDPIRTDELLELCDYEISFVDEIISSIDSSLSKRFSGLDFFGSLFENDKLPFDPERYLPVKTILEVLRENKRYYKNQINHSLPVSFLPLN